MLTSTDKKAAVATHVHFDDDVLYIALNDGREISIALDKINWLDWLYKAPPDQRAQWAIEPGGFAIYWESLDDGIEISHILGLESLS